MRWMSLCDLPDLRVALCIGSEGVDVVEGPLGRKSLCDLPDLLVALCIGSEGVDVVGGPLGRKSLCDLPVV